MCVCGGGGGGWICQNKSYQCWFYLNVVTAVPGSVWEGSPLYVWFTCASACILLLDIDLKLRHFCFQNSSPNHQKPNWSRIWNNWLAWKMQKIKHYSLLDNIVCAQLNKCSKWRGGGGGLWPTLTSLWSTLAIFHKNLSHAFCEIAFSAGPISLRIFNIL